MRLISVRVQNYKSVEDSTEFAIDEVTCLVGKNEAGKTAILRALEKLNPVDTSAAEFREEDYPRRRLATYKQREDRTPAEVLTTRWELDDEDLHLLAQHLGPDGVTSSEVVISKGYDNVVKVTIQLNHSEVVRHYVAAVGLDDTAQAQLGESDTVQAAIKKLSETEARVAKSEALLQELQAAFPKGSATTRAKELVLGRLPRLLYFPHYEHLPGKVALNDIKRRKAANDLEMPDRIFLALLELTSTSIDQIEGIDEMERLVMELEAVEASLTDQIKKYWSQNRHLEVRFRYDQARPGDPPPFNDGFIFNTRIFNTRHRATVDFGDRSHGFIWFFSFLVWLSRIQSSYGDNLILLLDEPGLPLHGRAQEDLLRYVNEQLRPRHQVIYSAHSPFMIDVGNIFSLRSVEDVVVPAERSDTGQEEILGTRVGDRVLSRDADTLFPLQGILGFNMTQTFFVGPNVVVVEGPTEGALFNWFARQLATRSRTSLDMRWAVCPAEGAAKISSFVTLFHGRGLGIAVLADYHTGQKRMIDDLEQSGLLKDGHLLKTSDFVGSDESDVEDWVGRPLYRHLLNRSLELPDQYAMPEQAPDDAEPRLVKEAEAINRTLPPGFAEFTHFAPVSYLLSLDSEAIAALPGLDQALDRFEAVFDRLNGLLDA